VAAVLYPDGIQTEEAYRLVCQVTEKACAHIGYGPEVELGPPHVPFTARGAYRKRYPPVDPQLVLDELELAGTSSYHPRREANRRSLWNKVAWEIYGKPLSALTEAQQAQIQAQVDAIAAGAGWECDDGADMYTKSLAVNADGARQRLARYLQDAGGRPVPVRTVFAQVQTGAYGRAFYHDELAPELAAIVADALHTHGYQAEPESGEYRPVPVAIPQDTTQSLSPQPWARCKRSTLNLARLCCCAMCWRPSGLSWAWRPSATGRWSSWCRKAFSGRRCGGWGSRPS
jgi:hypothetical protein